jgi:hypothetical protein
MPSTKEDRYVSTALNLLTLDKKSAASAMPFVFAILARVSRFSLLVLKPFAPAHLADGGLNLRPATSPVELNRNPAVSQVVQRLGLA